MKLAFAPPLLLALLQITPSTAFAPPSSQSATTSSLHSYGYQNQYDEYYSQHECEQQQQQQQQWSLYNEDVDVSRRDTTGAFFRGLTAAGAVVAGSALSRRNANAAEFSGGAVSPVQPSVSAPPPPTTTTPVRSRKSLPSFPSIKTPSITSSSPIQYKNSLAEWNEQGYGTAVAAAAVATTGVTLGVAATSQRADWAAPVTTAPAKSDTAAAAPETVEKKKPWYQPPTPYGIVNKGDNPFANKSQTPTALQVAGAPPPMGAAPYGLAAGRNYWDNRVLNTATSLPKPPPKASTPAPPPPPVTQKTLDNDKKKPWYQPPTPYGLVNQSNNPFLKDIQQYCQPGKVSEDCTESIDGYLNQLSENGDTPSEEEAATIVGYLDSLGGSTPAGKSAAPSTQSVKEALTNGSAVEAGSAAKVKDYLDALNIGKRDGFDTGMVMEAPPKKQQQQVKSGGSDLYQAYDDRLTGIETRVDSLEKKVDGIADEVFDRMEDWRNAQENRWNTGGVVGGTTATQQFGSSSSWNTGSSGVNGSGYVVPSPPSPPQNMRVKVTRNAPRSTGLGGYLESLNP